MSATDDEPAARDERVRVIEFWRAVEVFSPQPLPRPDARLRVTDAGPGEPAPWEPDSPRHEPPAPGKAWRHEVFGGVYELSRVRDTLTGLYGPDDDGGQREPAGGQSALFAVTVDGDGVLVPGTAALSSCAWAVGRALAAPGDLSLAGFSQDARLFGGDLGRLAGADAEAAGTLLAPLPGTGPDEPGRQPGRTASGASGADQEPCPLRGEQLRRFATRLGDRLGVAAALRPRGLRTRSYQVDADRADEQTAPSFLNSFYADDLARVAAAAADGNAGAGLTAYLTSGARIDAGCRVDVREQPDVVWHGCLPERIPPGRWPAWTGHSRSASSSP